MTVSPSSKQYTIIKFQQGNILLQHRLSKKIFEYVEPRSINKSSDISHPHLIKPVIYNNGLLFLKGRSTLENELQNRKRAHSLIMFEEEQIINTFIPIFQCLNHIHLKQNVHGSIHPLNIIITENDQIKLKDSSNYIQDNIYYFNKKSETTKEDDIIALGQIMTQIATLRKGSKVFSQSQASFIVENLIETYSKGFIFALIILVKRNKDKFMNIIKYLQNDLQLLNDIELNNLYESVKKDKEKKKTAMFSNENIIPNTPKPAIMSLNESPVKKSTPNSSLNNTIKRVKEDTENKKIFTDETKKKQIEKINKIIERSNEFVNELMARKNNQQILKKIAPKPNIGNLSVYGELTKKVKQQPLFQSSPTKRLRTFSKKK